MITLLIFLSLGLTNGYRFSHQSNRSCKLAIMKIDMKLEAKKLEELSKTILEYEYLIQIYHAISQRNEAQLGSFVDEEAQWKAQDQYDRDIITNHPEVVSKLAEAEDIVRTLTLQHCHI